MVNQLQLIDPQMLRSHEKTNVFRAVWLLAKILKQGTFIEPILVDTESMTILDGHHRHLIAKILRFKKVPCWCIHYLGNESVTVISRRQEIAVDKQSVIDRAKSGDLYPHKTTRHIYQAPKAKTFQLQQLID